MQDQWLYREVTRRLAHMGINIDVPPHNKPSVSRAALQLALEAVQSHMDANLNSAQFGGQGTFTLDSQEKHIPTVYMVVVYYGELRTGQEYHFLTSANTEKDAKAKVMREIGPMGLAKPNWLHVVNWSDLCNASNTKEAVFLYKRTWHENIQS